MTRQSYSQVSHDITMRWASSPSELPTSEIFIRTTWYYSIDDPFALTVSFPTENDKTLWTFARSLLETAMKSRSGEGDISFYPCHMRQMVDEENSFYISRIIMEMRSPTGYAALDTSREEIENFLDATHRLVAPNREAEFFNVDSLIEKLVSSS